MYILTGRLLKSFDSSCSHTHKPCTQQQEGPEKMYEINYLIHYVFGSKYTYVDEQRASCAHVEDWEDNNTTNYHLIK